MDQLHLEGGSGSPRRRLVLVCALFGLALVAYSGAVFHPFVGDDTLLIVENPRIRSLADSVDVIGPRWTRHLTHAVEYRIAGLWSPLYHLDNVLLHALVATLIFLLIHRVSGNEWLGWLTAALFAVHPIQAEVVAHVSGRRGLLAALFVLACLLFLERHLRSGRLWLLGAALLALYLAVFSKESGLMAVAVFPAVHFYSRFHSRSTGSDKDGQTLLARVRRIAWEGRVVYGAMAAGAVALILLRGVVQGAAKGSPGAYEEFGPPLGVPDRLSVVGLALRLLILPLGQSADYRYDALGFASGEHWPFPGVVHVGLLLVAVAATLLGVARRHWIGLGGVWFAVFFLPHTGIVPWHHVFAERFLYLPSIGFCLVLAALLLRVSSLLGGRRFATVAGLSILVVWTGATLVRTQVWGSELALWQNAVDRYPESASGHASLGGAHLRSGRPDLAVPHFDRALDILPGYTEARMGAVAAFASKGDFPEAQERLREFLDRNPRHRQALNLQGLMQVMRGEVDEAQTTFEDLIAANPQFEHGYVNLGRVYVMQGRVEDAVFMYKKALEMNPALELALRDLALLHREEYGDEAAAARYEQLAGQITSNP